MTANPRYSSISSQPLPIDFIDNRLAQYVPAFAGTAVRYDYQIGSYVPVGGDTTKMQGPKAAPPRPDQPEVIKMTFWDAIFSPAMKLFRSEHPNEPKKRVESGFGIRELPGWYEVCAVLQRAKEAYERPVGIRGRLGVGVRKTVDNSQKLTGVLALVPEVDITSGVLSVIKALIEAAKATAELRLAVTNGIEELDQYFADIESYISLYPEDQNITQACVKIVAFILKATEDVIGFYIQNKVLKTFRMVFDGESYKESLTNSLQAVSGGSNHLIREARKSAMWRSKNTNELAHEREESFSPQSSQRFPITNPRMLIIRAIIMDIPDSAKMSACMEKQHQMANTQNEILSLLQEGQRQRDYTIMCLSARLTYWENSLPPELQMKSQQDLAPTQERLRALLGVQAETSQVDVEHIVACQELLPRTHRDEVEALVSRRSFRTWITTPFSKELLVQGDFVGTHYVSALSNFCTTFSQTLQQAGGYITLVFFCGRHLDPNDPHTGGRGLIRTLIAQLLQQRQFDTRGLDEQMDLGLAEVGDIKQLTLLFRNLVLRLDYVTIFCMIDGIKYYERAAYLDDMSVVLAALLDIAEDQDTRSVFKLLITSPSPTHFVRKAVSSDSLLSMTAQSVTGERSGASRLVRHIEAELGPPSENVPEG